MLLRKCNLYHATDNAARYPRETPRRFAAPSIPQWMGRHVEVNCASPMVAQHYEDKQQAKAHRRHHEKIC
jgi:hypothetical protein